MERDKKNGGLEIFTKGNLNNGAGCENILERDKRNGRCENILERDKRNGRFVNTLERDQRNGR